MKKHKKIRSRMLLACLLAVAIIISLIPLLAAHPDDCEHSDSSCQITNSGGKLWYGDQGGAIGGAIGTGNAEPQDWTVSVSKTIAPRTNENEFAITLQVETTEEISDIEYSPDLAVVIVIDMSTSMMYTIENTTTLGTLYNNTDYNTYKNGTSRIAIAKTQARAFLDSFIVGAGNARRMVSLVTFGSDANVRHDWINVNSADGMASVKSRIDALTADLNEYTFLQGGLQLASNMLKRDSVSGMLVQNQFIVALTDGNPTYMKAVLTEADLSASANTITGGAMASMDFLANTVETEENVPLCRSSATAVADTIRDSGVKLYTIAAGTPTDNFSVSVPNSGTKIPASQWLKNYIAYNESYHYIANTGNELIIAFSNISASMTRWAEAWTVSDPMGAGIVFDTSVAENSNALSFADNTLTWDIKEWNTSGTRTSLSGKTVYIYAYTYNIVLNTLVRTTDGATNGMTKLTYALIQEINGVRTVEEPVTAQFLVPQVQGYAGSIAFKKVGDVEPGAGLDNFGFALWYDGAQVGDTVYSTTVGETPGIVTFSNIPSGRTYLLKEVYNPRSALYATDNASYPVTVSWGVATCAFNTTDNPFVDRAINVPVALQKSFSNDDLSLQGVPIEWFCDIDEHAHVEECGGWINTLDLSTATSLEGDPEDNPDWVWGDICGIDAHEHIDGICFYDANELEGSYTFTFSITASASNAETGVLWSASRDLTLPRSEILGYCATGLPYIDTDFFTIPSTEIGNGPFIVRETGTGLGWTWTAANAGDTFPIDLESAPNGSFAAPFMNDYGQIRRPWFRIVKNMVNTRGAYGGDFLFGLYYDEECEQEAISGGIPVTNSNGYIALVKLGNEFLEYNGTLYLKEKPGNVAGMDYDRHTVYAINIADGEATIAGLEGHNAFFTNYYYAPATPEFRIVKTTNGYGGTFTFDYAYDGTIWDGVGDIDEIERTPASGGGSVTVAVGSNRGETLVSLTDLTNFTGSITISERAGSAGSSWTYDPVMYQLHFVEGEFANEGSRWLDGREASDDEAWEAGKTLDFYNSYTYTYNPPPEVTDYYGTLTVTKAFTGITEVPGNWSAEVNVTGPGGYNRSATVTGAARTVTFRQLQPGSYTVTETGASGIANYTLIDVVGEGVYNVSANNTTRVTLTNNYATDRQTTPPPETTTETEIGDPQNPLTESPPGDDELLEDGPPPLAELPPIDTPTSDMPSTGDTGTLWLWGYVFVVSIITTGSLIVVMIVTLRKCKKAQRGD